MPRIRYYQVDAYTHDLLDTDSSGLEDALIKIIGLALEESVVKLSFCEETGLLTVALDDAMVAELDDSLEFVFEAMEFLDGHVADYTFTFRRVKSS